MGKMKAQVFEDEEFVVYRGPLGGAWIALAKNWDGHQKAMKNNSNLTLLARDLTREQAEAMYNFIEGLRNDK